jgi:hypothetical protein
MCQRSPGVSGEDALTEWIDYKAPLKKELQKVAGMQRKLSRKLKASLEKRRKELWRKRAAGIS